MDQELEEYVEENEEENELLEAEEEEIVDPRTLLTKEQVEYYKSLFESFDVNKKEKIPAKTVGFVLRLMGLNPTKAQVKQHIQEIDPQNKGLIDFQSFLLPIAQKINDEPETHEDIITAFKTFDEENNEFVYTDQLVEYLTTLGEDLEDFEIELFIKMAETKGTGRVQYIDFVEKMFGIVRKNPKDKKKKDAKKSKKK